VDRLRHHDKRNTRFVPFQSLEDRLPEIPREEFARAVHWIAPDGLVSTGAQAMLCAAAGHSPAARLALQAVRRVPGVRHVAELVYRWVTRNRHRFK
jgi:predicted DCC family thiol-disulfide oxidoreductase YuxK